MCFTLYEAKTKALISCAVAMQLISTFVSRFSHDMAHMLLRNLMITVEFLIFRTPENFSVIALNFEQRSNQRVICPKDADRMANSEDPDQTARSALFTQTCLSKNFGSLMYHNLLALMQW